jgi:CubicO group peptidase (beta-lactamase class C family)
LLGLILERATGTSVSEYLERKIWNRLGMEQDALWVVDSRKKGFEVVNSGLTAIPMDMAKFGRLYLTHGKWGNETIMSDEWIRSSTRPDSLSLSFWRNISAYGGRDVYFNDMWWGLGKKNLDYEFSANGHFGQRIYIVPEKNAMILRFGSSGRKLDWTSFMHSLAAKL